MNVDVWAPGKLLLGLPPYMRNAHVLSWREGMPCLVIPRIGGIGALMVARDTNPHVELAGRRTVGVPTERADFERVARDVLLELLRDGGEAIRDELAKPRAATGGGVDRFGRVLSVLAIASVLARRVSTWS